jgi:gamma-glutamylcyclotransferase (GGCT)/AIG2-like uncharacterized protein YtfP
MNHALMRFLKFIGEGKVNGIMFALGSYPGTIEDKTNEVFGEMYEIDSAELMQRLDSIEFGAGFIRKLVTAKQNGGNKVKVWIWYYNRTKKELMKYSKIVKDGVWSKEVGGR